MPRFYFHIIEKGEVIADEEGSVCASVEAAIDEAKASARDIAKDLIGKGEPLSEVCVEVHDGDGMVISAVRVEDVVNHPRFTPFNPSCGTRDLKGPAH